MRIADAEAARKVIVGVGCRKGKGAGEIMEAIGSALARIEVAPEEVRLLATADVKASEPGLLEASVSLGIPLSIIESKEIRRSTLTFERSDFVEKNVNLPAVAEPAALLAGRRTKLILQKTAFNGITIAIAEENSISSESGRADLLTARRGPKRPLRKATSLSDTVPTSNRFGT